MASDVSPQQAAPHEAIRLFDELQAALDKQPHRHSAWCCPAHIDNCTCPDLKGWLCNPYWVSGYCPDDLDVMP